MNKIKLSESELRNVIQESVVKVLKEDAKRKRLNEDASQLLSVLGGTAIVGLTSWGIAEVLGALESGKLGENGKKLAKMLGDLGSAANSGK